MIRIRRCTQMYADEMNVGAVRERVWAATRCKPFVPARQMDADKRGSGANHPAHPSF